MLYDYSPKCCLSVKFIMHETTNAETWVKLNLYNLGSIL